MLSLQLQGSIELQGAILFNTSYLWEFRTPPAGTIITNFSVNTTGSVPITIDWGDGSSSIISSGVITTHTF